MLILPFPAKMSRELFNIFKMALQIAAPFIDSTPDSVIISLL